MKPSGPGALEEPELKRAWITSHSVGVAQRIRLSSAEIMGEKRTSISSSTGGREEANKLEKWETKDPPIAALSKSQAPVPLLRKLTALDFLLIMVEE
jgi:hypothetical protein